MTQKIGSSILLISSDESLRDKIKKAFASTAHSMQIADSYQQGIILLSKHGFDFIFAECDLSDSTSAKNINELSKASSYSAIIALYENSSADNLVEIYHAGAIDFICAADADNLILKYIESPPEVLGAPARTILPGHKPTIPEQLFKLSSRLQIDQLVGEAFDFLIDLFKSPKALCAYFEDPAKEPHALYSRELDQAEEKRIIEFLRGRLDRDNACYTGEDTEEAESNYEYSDLGLAPLSAEELARLVEGEAAAGLYMPLCSRKGQIGGAIFIVDHDLPPLPPGLSGYIADRFGSFFSNALKYRQAEELVYIDSLTELYNARYLQMILNQELKRAERYRSELAFLFLDIDHFKIVNDTHGHLIGSKVLVEVGEILKDNVREVDLVFRYGGDEFAVLLVETGKQGGIKVAERLRKNISEFSFAADEDISLNVTTCIGVASYPYDTTDVNHMIELADKAMYKGKHKNRNAVHCAPDREL